MPRYFFDIHDGHHLIRDAIGIECSHPDDIRSEVLSTLPAIARDVIPKDGQRQALMALVRNASNLTVYTATMTIAELWLGEDPPPCLADDDTDDAASAP